MNLPGETSREQVVLAGGAVVTTLRGSTPGPTLALLGGVHGDEDEGVLAVWRVLHELASAPLAGTVKAVAPANAHAWAVASRTGPLDGANLARSFPGDADGGPTAALARGITDGVIEGADLLIDLHSAGEGYRMPLFCGFIRDVDGAKRSRQAAEAFGAPIIWSHVGVASGRSLSVAAERGIPAIYAECSGGGGVRGHELDAYVHGVQAVMVEFGMLPESYRRYRYREPQWVYDGGGDLDEGVRSSIYGLFVSDVTTEDVVHPDREMGRIYDYSGNALEIVRPPFEGIVMFLRRRARIRRGDVLYALAQLDDGAKNLKRRDSQRRGK